MHDIAKKVIRTIKDKSIDICSAINMLLDSKPLLDSQSALSYLQDFSPDLGKSCRRESSSDYEQRGCDLSVIVPAYNAEKYIANCLESILRQKVSFSYEVIVVNDGSTDTTASVLESYGQNNKIKIFHQNNAGASAARNNGIAHSKGEYLCFVDSDDDLPEGALECLMTTALRENAKLVVGSYAKCLSDGIVKYVGNLRDQKEDELRLPGFSVARVIHYSVFQNLKFPENYWFEDSIMAQIIHPLCQERTYTVSHLCYRYYCNDAGATSLARGKKKSIDSLWITMRLLEERQLFNLPYTQHSYAYFLSMVNLTYQRTKYLGPQVAKCIFAVQRMLLDRYYCDYQITENRKKQQIQDALRKNDFRKYILACEMKR